MLTKSLFNKAVVVFCLDFTVQWVVTSDIPFPKKLSLQAWWMYRKRGEIHARCRISRRKMWKNKRQSTYIFIKSTFPVHLVIIRVDSPIIWKSFFFFILTRLNCRKFPINPLYFLFGCLNTHNSTTSIHFYIHFMIWCKS